MFSGRSGRTEYWYFWLFWLIVMIALTVVNVVLFGPTVEFEQQLIIAQDGTETINENQKIGYDSGVFGSIFMLLMFIPGIAVASRRLHDTGRSGWWQLMPFAATLVVFPMLFIATLGLGGAVEAFQVTGNVQLEVGALGTIFIIALLAAFLILLFWLCQKSQPGPNKYGPNPHEVPQ